MDLSAFTQLKVSLSDHDQVLRVRLDHGKVNACGSEVIADFERLATFVREQSGLKALVMSSNKVTRSGKSIFVAGADVTERVGWTDEQVIAHVNRQRQALLSLRTLPVFSVVVVNGLALGLGTELMLAFDYRIATTSASFALPETGLGIIPGALGSALLASLVGPNQALRMGCTGDSIPGKEAARIGLVDEFQDNQEAALKRVQALIDKLLLKSPRAVAAYKRCVLEGAGYSEETRIATEARRYEVQVRNGDAAMGRASFKDIREGKAPNWAAR